MKTNEYMEQTEQYVLHTYNRFPLVIDHGEGVHLYDTDGKAYLDFAAGIAVYALGYSNDDYKKAVKDQVDKVIHVSNLFYNVPMGSAAEKLAKASGMDKVFFTNSGTESIEGAIKVARKYAYLKDGSNDHEIIAMNHSFHGRSLGALSVTGNTHYQDPFKPLISGIHFAEYNNLESVKSLVNEKTCAIILEPVQGEGGIFPADRDYLQALRDRCDQTGTLLIYDEIQTGLGRTGTLYFFQQYGIVPDILCTAKAFGGGMPLGAFIASNRIMSVLKTNPVLGHITTFGGHPVCCAAGLAALEYILSERLTELADAKGALYESLLAGHPLVREIRRTGLLLGVEFGDSELTARIVLRAIDRGLMTEWFLFHDTAMRIAPPLTITDAEIRESCEILLEVLNGAAE